MTEHIEYIAPAKEKNAPEGYTLCNRCKGQRLLGPDGSACVCAIYGRHSGYMKKRGLVNYVSLLERATTRNKELEEDMQWLKDSLIDLHTNLQDGEVSERVRRVLRIMIGRFGKE